MCSSIWCCARPGAIECSQHVASAAQIGWCDFWIFSFLSSKLGAEHTLAHVFQRFMAENGRKKKQNSCVERVCVYISSQHSAQMHRKRCMPVLAWSVKRNRVHWRGIREPRTKTHHQKRRDDDGDTDPKATKEKKWVENKYTRHRTAPTFHKCISKCLQRTPHIHLTLSE